MAAPDPFLDRIDIASPCSASWDAMKGDDRSRHCGDCRLDVYNLSAMSRKEAERLLRGRTGRICARFFRRADGTVITQDCGPIRRAIGRRLRRMRVAATALFGLLSAFATAACGERTSDSSTRPAPPRHAPQPDPEPMMGEAVVEPLMGDVRVPAEHLGRMVVPPAPRDR